MYPIASCPPTLYVPLPTIDRKHASRKTNEVLAAEWARTCPTDPQLLGAILEDVNASCCRFIWAHDGVDNDADGIRRIQTGNGAGIIKAVDSRLENGTISANPRAVELRLRSQGGYGRVCTFELAYSAQRWHNGKKVGEKERDAAQAALSGEIGEPCFLNCGEYLLVKMLQENLCSKDELQALASAVAQRRSGLKRRFRNLMAASDWRRLQSDDELPLPDATLPDFDTWQNRRQIHHQINAQDAGGSLPSSEVSKHRGDGENDLIGEALDPNRSLTHRFYWREPQRGDIAWVMEGDMRRHVGMVVGRDGTNGIVGIVGLNSASSVAAHGFRWGPKIELYPPTKCRSYPLHDVVAHLKDYCRGPDPSEGSRRPANSHARQL